MRTAEEIFNEIKSKIYSVLSHGLERDEITVLVPSRDFDKMLAYCGGQLVINHIIIVPDGTEVTTVMGVTLQSVKDINKIYICL